MKFATNPGVSSVILFADPCQDFVDNAQKSMGRQNPHAKKTIS